MSANWGRDVWDQYDRVCSHADNGNDFVKRVQQYTKDRMKIEAEYAKELRKLAKSYQKRKEDDMKYSDVSAFYKMVKEADDLAGQHEVIVENSNTRVQDALKKLQHDLHREKKAHDQEGIRHSQNYRGALANLEKAKKKYEAATQEAERAQIAFDKASQDMNLTRAAVEKTRQFSMQKNDQAEEAKGNYLVCLDQTNQFQREHFFTRMPEVFSSFQRMEEGRVDTIKQLMHSLLDIELAVQPIITKCRDNIRESINSIDGARDSMTFVEDHRTGYLPPADRAFEEYSSSKLKTKGRDSKPATNAPREDFGHLPPAKRKKKLQGKVKELEDAVKKETSEHTALEKMYQVYSANPSLGDPTVVQQQLVVIGEKIENLNEELYKFESYLAQAEGKDPPLRRASPGKIAPPHQGNNSQAAAAATAIPAGSAGPTQPAPRQQPPVAQAAVNSGPSAPPPPQETFDEGDEFDQFCVVLYDFTGSNEGEMSVKAGERVKLLENDGSGWIRVRCGEGEGYIPLSYADIQG